MAFDFTRACHSMNPRLKKSCLLLLAMLLLVAVSRVQSSMNRDRDRSA